MEKDPIPHHEFDLSDHDDDYGAPSPLPIYPCPDAPAVPLQEAPGNHDHGAPPNSSVGSNPKEST